jgi:dienelactone hydrolase
VRRFRLKFSGTLAVGVVLAILIGWWLLGLQPGGWADAEEWEARRALFQYDKAQPLNATTTIEAEGARIVQERIEFDSPKGGRVAGLLVRPRGQNKPRVILFLHGLGGSKRDAQMVGAMLASKGYATLGLDAAGHGDRKQPEERFFDPQTGAGQSAVIQTVIDYRRAIDYLETREDVDAGGVAVLGASMGAMVGALVAAVDERVAAALLVVGGGGWAKLAASSQHPVAAHIRQRLEDPEFAKSLEQVDPANYVGHISPRPVWMVNGRDDKIVPPASAEALHQAAKEPKRVVWYEGGHIPDIPLVVRVISEWIDHCLSGSDEVTEATQREAVPATAAGQ